MGSRTAALTAMLSTVALASLVSATATMAQHVPLPVPAPQPGDLAYFRRTRRSDRGGKGRDRLTHVAIIEAVDGPSVILIHRASRGIRRLAMNLARPHDPDENGIVRRRWGGDKRRVPSLAGELFAGYGTALSGKREPPPSFSVESSPPQSDRDGVPRG